MPPGGASLAIAGNRFEAASMGATYAGTLELDASREPKIFDLVFTAGPEQGNRALGIYRLEGDMWSICLTVTAKTRPAEFSAPAGSGLALEVLSRGVPVPVAPAVASFPHPAIPDPDIEGEWQMLTCLRSGEPLEQRMLNSGIRQADARQVTVHFGSHLFSRALYTTDRRAKPRTIDYLHTEGALAGQMQLGIYRIEAGILTHCFASPGDARPAAFESLPGDGRTLATWKRK